MENSSSTNPWSSNATQARKAIERQAEELKAFFHRMGRDARQGAIGFVLDRDYLEISFPLEQTAPTKRPKAKKRR